MKVVPQNTSVSLQQIIIIKSDSCGYSVSMCVCDLEAYKIKQNKKLIKPKKQITVIVIVKSIPFAKVRKPFLRLFPVH